MRRVCASLFGSLLLTLSAVSVFAQSCPMCKESMTQAGDKLSHGFFLSIISLFALPFALIGGIGTVVLRSWWARRYPNIRMTLGALIALIRRRGHLL